MPSVPNEPTALRDGDGRARTYALLLSLAAAVYPATIVGLYGAGDLLRAAPGPAGRLDGAVAFALALLLALSVPTLGLTAAHLLGRVDNPSATVIRARRLAHLVAACPALFTLLGVLLYLMHVASADYLAWAALWGAIGVGAQLGGRARDGGGARPVPPGVRAVHGVTALCLLLFILPHLANHLAGVWSADSHVAVMKVLRTVYRHTLVEPVLILLVALQVGTGAILNLRRTALPVTSVFDTIQTCAGTYLAIFLVSHVTAVLVLGRVVMAVDTNFYFASGGDKGLLGELWNARLVPHYGLAPLSLLSHLACGLRSWMARHAQARADGLARFILGLGAVVGALVVAALCRVHLSAG